MTQQSYKPQVGDLVQLTSNTSDVNLIGIILDVFSEQLPQNDWCRMLIWASGEFRVWERYIENIKLINPA
jgi:hypothetical protein